MPKLSKRLAKSQSQLMEQIVHRLSAVGLKDQFDVDIFLMLGEDSGTAPISLACNMDPKLNAQIGAALSELVEEVEFLTAPSYVIEGMLGELVAITGRGAYLKLVEDLENYAADPMIDSILPFGQFMSRELVWQ